MKKSKVVEKYEGKTVRVDNRVYVIGILEGSNQTNSSVWLHHKYGDAIDASSDVNLDADVDLRYADPTHIKAIKKAKEILEALEKAEETDF